MGLDSDTIDDENDDWGEYDSRFGGLLQQHLSPRNKVMIFYVLALLSSLVSFSFIESTNSTSKYDIDFDGPGAQPESKSKAAEPLDRFGWQPGNTGVDNDTSCSSLSFCETKKSYSLCPHKCLVSQDPFDNPPPRPGFTPDLGATKKENNEKAWNVTWIPDVTYLRRMLEAGKDENGNPWPPPLVTTSDQEFCGNFGDHQQLLDAINVTARSMLSEWGEAEMATKKMTRQPKVMCFIYTVEGQHAIRIRAMRETWAPGCDGFLAFSTKDDPRIPAISIPHIGPEEYGNMWQKARSMWKFVGTHYLEDFDFFMIGGDDMYVMPQNLRDFLGDQVEDPTREHYYGGELYYGKEDGKEGFHLGGPGYVLSQATLRSYINELFNHDKCFPNTKKSAEDRFMGYCLQRGLGIIPNLTFDEKGRERFNNFPPAHYWGLAMKGVTTHMQKKTGVDCCAPDSISWHYLKSSFHIRSLHAYLYFCK